MPGGDMEPELANSLYYTFSTIAQALASAIGFLAAAVLYRLQNLDAAVFPHGDRLVTLWPDVSANDSNQDALKAWRAWRRRDYSALLTFLRGQRNKWDTPERRDDFGRFEALAGQRARLLCSFYVSLVLTAATIAGAGLALIRVHRLQQGTGECVLAIGYVFFFSCLLSYVAVSVFIFREGAEAQQ